MAHIVFVDSSATGLAAFATARRLGDRVTFVRPKDLLFAEMFGLKSQQLEAALQTVDRTVEIASLSGSSLLSALRKVHAEDPIDALITVSELAVLPVADAAAALGVRTNDPKAVRTAVFKDRCRAHLEARGLRSTRYAKVSSYQEACAAAEQIGWPVMLKATRSVGKQLAALCRCDDDLQGFFESEVRTRASMHPSFQRFVSQDFMVEEYLQGQLYSAEVGMADGRFFPLVLTKRARASHNELVEIGAFMPSDLDAENTQSIFAYVEEILSSIGLGVGMFHVEVILTADGPVLVEINPRMMGGTLPQMYGHVAEVDPFEILIALHTGRPLDPDRLAPRHAAGSLALGALNGGVTPTDVSARLDDVFARYDLFENTLNLSPETPLPAFANNFTAIGRLGFSAHDHKDAVGKGRHLIADLEAALNCELATY